MYHHSILQPFKFNWKYTAPRSFTELEYFITPDLSIGVNRMSNGKNDFAIGAYLTESANRGLFENEYLVKRSGERVKKAFQKEEVSVFFTPQEAEEMELLFNEEKFIAKEVNVYKNNVKTDLFKLDEGDFSKVMDVFAELNVQQTTSLRTEKETFETLRSDMYEEAFTKAKQAFSERSNKRERVTKKQLYKQAGIGSGLLIAGSLLKRAGRALMDKGKVGLIAGAVCHLAATVCGLVGLKCVSGATEYYTQGVVFE